MPIIAHIIEENRPDGLQGFDCLTLRIPSASLDTEVPIARQSQSKCSEASKPSDPPACAQEPFEGKRRVCNLRRDLQWYPS